MTAKALCTKTDLVFVCIDLNIREASHTQILVSMERWNMRPIYHVVSDESGTAHFVNFGIGTDKTPWEDASSCSDFTAQQKVILTVPKFYLSAVVVKVYLILAQIACKAAREG